MRSRVCAAAALLFLLLVLTLSGQGSAMAGIPTNPAAPFRVAEPTDAIVADLQRFAIQDAEGKWHWAKARIDGETVLVWNDDVKAPAQVRFGYESNPAGINLYNREGLPASPFTTD